MLNPCWRLTGVRDHPPRLTMEACWSGCMSLFATPASFCLLPAADLGACDIQGITGFGSAIINLCAWVIAVSLGIDAGKAHPNTWSEGRDVCRRLSVTSLIMFIQDRYSLLSWPSASVARSWLSHCWSSPRHTRPLMLDWWWPFSSSR